MAERIDPVYAALAWWPVAWHAAGAALAWLLPSPWRWPALAVWVLLLPPLLCRTVDRCAPRRGTLDPRAARRWWWLQQLQLPFNRIPVLEEALRLVPGLSQAWLWLWGARISPFCVIAPGARITDRQLVRVGRGAVLGAGCLLGGHLVVREDGGWRVIVAEVEVGAGAIVGARAVLGPGARVAPGEQLPATQALPPFQRWEGGRRRKADA